MLACWQIVVDVIAQEFAGFTDGPWQVRLLVRLSLAVALGGLLGYQRALSGKSAGMRTHMLVTLGAALFVLLPQMAGGTSADMSRVIQGVVTGIGFIGAGAILKLSKKQQVLGLTTAADLWLATAIGMAAGLGQSVLAVLGTGLAMVILSVFFRFEPRPANETAATLDRERSLASSPPRIENRDVQS